MPRYERDRESQPYLAACERNRKEKAAKWRKLPPVDPVIAELFDLEVPNAKRCRR